MHSVPSKHLLKLIIEVLKFRLRCSNERTIVCIHKAGNALLMRHILQIHPPPVQAVVNPYPRVGASPQDVAHHAVDVYVGEDGTFNGALPDSTGHFKPFTILILRAASASRVRVKVPEKFDKAFGQPLTSEGPP